ncbi:extracellular solute-binding protein [Aeromicrobium wangtongii]|uniref:Extracellular solute-binding protein n=1 Tax=Aeromicrobium wangtongii TaxID=2969247 RepID=A0ABY5MDP6_9ACTN|nr:extracellular solute-binding protein [Aeromicrobium wangtongii]MCD9197778.1 extracellular solute-binding protein [Aeromicrobium wangtongii]UUP15261.1 extracellular solute-binding protein [Aeromicrobium wangtongii]
MPDLKGQTITINTYGGSMAEAFDEYVVKPFESATGAKVKLVTTCCTNFQSTVEKDQYAGDIVLGNDYGPMAEWSKAGLLKSDDRLTQIATARGIEKGYFQDDLLAVDFYAYVLAWNSKRVSNPPATWADFFDTGKFEGKRGVFTQPGAMYEAALLAEGVARDEMYPLDEDKALAAFRKLKQAGKLATWTDGADLTNKLGTGEFDYAIGFSNRLMQAKDSGVPVDFTFDGAIRVASAAAIPVNARNVDGAVAFLDFYMQPEIQAQYAQPSAFAPAYSSANELLDPEVAAQLVTAEENITKSVKYDDPYWSANFEAHLKNYTAFLNGN